MTDDAALRALERRVTLGEPVDRAQLVAARLRAGVITRDRVVLAAWLDDAVARAIVGDAAAPRPATPGFPALDSPELGAWARALDEDGGLRALARALCEVLRAWPDISPDAAGMHELLASVERWAAGGPRPREVEEEDLEPLVTRLLDERAPDALLIDARAESALTWVYTIVEVARLPSQPISRLECLRTLAGDPSFLAARGAVIAWALGETSA